MLGHSVYVHSLEWRQEKFKIHGQYVQSHRRTTVLRFFFTVYFRLVVRKRNIEFQIDESHSAKLSSWLNAIGQIIFQYCVMWTTNLNIPKRKYVSNLDLDGTGVTRSFAASPLISSLYRP